MNSRTDSYQFKHSALSIYRPNMLLKRIGGIKCPFKCLSSSKAAQIYSSEDGAPVFVTSLERRAFVQEILWMYFRLGSLHLLFNFPPFSRVCLAFCLECMSQKRRQQSELHFCYENESLNKLFLFELRIMFILMKKLIKFFMYYIALIIECLIMF